MGLAVASAVGLKVEGKDGAAVGDFVSPLLYGPVRT